MAHPSEDKNAASFLYRHTTTTCAYCYRSFTDTNPKTLDHVWPKRLRKEQSDITVKACLDCNRRKADASPAEWLTFMQENPQWWTLPMKPLKPKMKKW